MAEVKKICYTEDVVSMNRLKGLHPKLVDEALAAYDEINKALTGRAICRIAQATRTFKEQQNLYYQGRRGVPREKIVTNARPGMSFHNYGLAIDIVLLVDRDKNGTFEAASWETNIDFDADGVADWMDIVKILTKRGWKWGGLFKTFKDMPHFEFTFGYTIAQLFALRNAGKVDDGGFPLLK
jgi:peptidoglycan L-alanyl-D-glutamate endopeptidase CwlK